MNWFVKYNVGYILLCFVGCNIFCLELTLPESLIRNLNMSLGLFMAFEGTALFIINEVRRLTYIDN